MRQVLYSLLMALIWCLFYESFEFNTFILGFFVSLLIIFFLRRAYLEPYYMQRVLKIIRFGLSFLKELSIANLAVIRIVYKPGVKNWLKPGFVEYPLTVNTDFTITLLANSITLTPGTLSVDVSPDKKFLYIHFLHIDDPKQARESIKNGLERPILQIWNREPREELHR